MIYPMELIERQPVVGWETVKPARYASRPPEYLQALAELDDAWNDFNRIADLREQAVQVEDDCAAATRKVIAVQKKVSRMYYMLNLAPIVPDEVNHVD